jgi:hypothetical protein
VWLNPPYGKFWPRFVARCVGEFEARRIDKAILLLRANHVPTEAFCKAMRVDYLICFPRRRVNFDSSVFKVSSVTQRRSLSESASTMHDSRNISAVPSGGSRKVFATNKGDFSHE